MPNPPKEFRVFLASPGDLADERRAFKDQVDLVNLGFGDGANVKFIPLGWEDTLATVGRRSQAVINEEIDRCDVFILAMHRRWGQAAEDAKPYSSYTEEEFHRALDRWKKAMSPEIFVFFKHVDPELMADAGPQLAQVLKFRRELEASRIVLYRLFNDETEFKAEIDKHLRAFARGELPKADADREKIILPIEYVERVERAEKAAKKAAEQAEAQSRRADAQAARVTEFALTFARKAAQAALDGRVEEARQDFAKAIDGTTDLQVLYLAFEFYYRTGDWSVAEQMLERWLAISGPDAETAETAAAYSNLGLIFQTRGNLEQAEAMLRKSLAISEKLGLLEGMANGYGNLGLIDQTRGDLAQAETMHRKSLEIEEKLGRLEGIAETYGHLGRIYQTRGDLDQAETMLRKSLAINEKLGRLEGMANQYCFLGDVYFTRGDLDHAENMHRKSLAINEKLDRLEGIASDYGNFGAIYLTRGVLDQAETFLRKSLAIEEKLGRLEGMARQYANLGSVAGQRGDRKTARELWVKSRDLYAKIGIPHMVKQLQEGLDKLPVE
ncbi:MAG: tetratricopeptide repeat protein [Planctomycetota bacterium]|mgnify:CR=1 FL=1